MCTHTKSITAIIFAGVWQTNGRWLVDDRGCILENQMVEISKYCNFGIVLSIFKLSKDMDRVSQLSNLKYKD